MTENTLKYFSQILFRATRKTAFSSGKCDYIFNIIFFDKYLVTTYENWGPLTDSSKIHLKMMLVDRANH